MKVYIATGYENRSGHNRLRDKLAEHGIGLTCDWTTHESIADAAHWRIADIAHDDIQGVRDADAVVVLLPGGRGTHVEIGAAIAFGKLVIIVGDMVGEHERECVFYHHAGVACVASCDEAVSLLRELKSFREALDDIRRRAI